jgi:hypothetical protein
VTTAIISLGAFAIGSLITRWLTIRQIKRMLAEAERVEYDSETIERIRPNIQRDVARRGWQ